MTALASSGDYLLAGEGSHLKIYSRCTLGLLTSLDLFEKQSIHGIRLDPNNDSTVIIWGGPLVTVLRLSKPASDSLCPGVNHLCEPLTAPDWILDVAFRPADLDSQSAETEIALVTAHNALLLLRLNYRAAAAVPVLKKLTSQSKCILYSAHVLWTTSDNALIASGTVFGEIIIWSYQFTADSAGTVLHKVLTGHDGSIFGVHISDIIHDQVSGRQRRLLASCSDDRTVRIWDLTDLAQVAVDPQGATDLPMARETGFGGSMDNMMSEAAHTDRSLATAWGHMSRIWAVSFVKSTDVNIVANLVTFGEDATCHFWHLIQDSESRTPSSTETLVFRKVDVIPLHAGKNIWSSSISSTNHEDLVITTGGADGSISVLPTTVPFTRPDDFTRSSTIADVVRSSEFSLASQSDKLRSYAFVSETELLIATNSGNIFLSNHSSNRKLDSGDSGPWKWIAHEKELRGYSVAASSPRHSVVQLSGMSGSLFCYTPKHGLNKVLAGTCKTAAILIDQSSQQQAQDTTCKSLLTRVEQNMASLLYIEDISLQSDQVPGISETKVQLPPGFIVTSFAMSLASDGRSLLFLGSRNGAIAAYEYCESTESTGKSLRWITLIGSAHGEDAVTDMIYAQEVLHTSTHNILYSTGRDGFLAAHHIVKDHDMITLELVHRLPVPEATTVERVMFDTQSGTLLVAAFRSKHFIIYDMKTEQEVISIDCGGPNRTWTFNHTGAGGTLAWTKASQLCMHTTANSKIRRINSGGHGREIKAMAVSPMTSDVGQLIATGAEDTNIKLHRLVGHGDKLDEFRCVRTLRKHKTGVQHLEWSSDGRFLFSSGGFEELFVWRMRSIQAVDIGVVCESVCPPESLLPDLRITCLSVLQEASTADYPHTHAFTVGTVRSDSTLRVYQYRSSPREKSWSCLFAGTYRSCSLTQILHVPFKGEVAFFTAGTDGYVSIFPTNPSGAGQNQDPVELHQTKRFKAHQNTIHHAELRHLSDHDHLLFTAGDDNAISLSRLHNRDDAMSDMDGFVLTIPRAHAAAVTGLAVMDLSDEHDVNKRFWLVSVSIDQRLKLWVVDIDTRQPGVRGVEVSRLQDSYTPVADASSLVYFEDRNGPGIVVGGVGMEVRRLKGSRAADGVRRTTTATTNHSA